MAEFTTRQFAARLCDLKLVSRDQMRAIGDEYDFDTITTEQLADMLLHWKLLTPYQINRLMKGEKTGFFIGPHKVLRLISQGTFAHVFEAVLESTGERFALKVLRKKQAEDTEVRNRFRREGELCLTLKHEHIAQVLAVHCPSATNHFVMELVEGGSLKELIAQRKRVAPVDATLIMQQMASALYYAATRGLLHRDLKETNVLIDHKGQVKLIDFGLAAIDEDFGKGEIKVNDASIKTIDYSVLEKLTKVRAGDHRSDIFFAGCIFYHMLCGEPPLSDTRDPEERSQPDRFTRIRPIHEVDRSLPGCATAIVNKAMRIAPALRYQSFGEMLVDLRAAHRTLLKEMTNPPAKKKKDAFAGRDPSASSISKALGPSAPILLFLEKDEELQEVFRQVARHNRCQALLYSDPEQALKRLTNEFEEGTIAAGLFDASGIGKGALDVFNRLAADPNRKNLPAVLLVNKEQAALREQAVEAPHRMVLTVPCKIEELLGAMSRVTQVAPQA